MDMAEGLVHHISNPKPLERPDGMSVDEWCDFLVDELEEKIIELGPERVGAFIAEPILGSGGVVVPPPGYHQRTLDVCRKHDVLYISDEVVTAFGRLGSMLTSCNAELCATRAGRVGHGRLPVGHEVERGRAAPECLPRSDSLIDLNSERFDNVFEW